jgi:MFS transporter, PAT family, solute carrier family 33 (acetyl-CoA transportor), member 1
MQFCSVFSFVVTIWLLFIKEVTILSQPDAHELMSLRLQDKEHDDEDLSIKNVYLTMWNICKLKRK